MDLMKRLGRGWNALRKNWIFQVSAAVLLGLVLLGVILWSQLQPKWQKTHAEAFTVGDQTVSAVTMNYYFRDAYDGFLGAYQNMADAGQLIDPSTPLNLQQYSEEGTWADFLFETALSNATRTEAIYAEALAQGYDYDAKAAAKEHLDTLRQKATEQGYNSLTAFLRSFYGPNATEKTYTEYLQHTLLADSYSHSIYDESQDQDQWDAWFAERIESQPVAVADTARDALYYAP